MSNTDIVTRNNGPIKYSELLQEFVHPYIHECRNFGDVKYLMSFGAMAWNMAVSKRLLAFDDKDVLREAKEHKDWNDNATEMLDELIERNNALYGHHKILFANVELIENKKAYGLSVAVHNID